MCSALIDDPARTLPACQPNGRQGNSSPLGVTPCREGVYLYVFSKAATGIVLRLFDDVDDAQPARAICIDVASNCIGHYWHVFVPGVMAGQIYGYFVEGPWDPS